MIQIDFSEEFAAIVTNAVDRAFAKHYPPTTLATPPTERKQLNSIRELGDFLSCSTVTAQKLKNSGQLPYRQIGRKVIFFTDEVLKAMEPAKRKGVKA